MRCLRYILALILTCVGLVLCQETTTGDRQAQSAGAPISGKRLYASYCSMCHGTDAKGGGPFSTQLKTWPPDLTQIRNKNNGTFPSLHIAEVIDGEFEKPAHGSREMPVWGPVFRSMAHGRKDSAQRRIDNLVKYIESLQQN